MMEREWRGILNRYGQQVMLYRGEEAVPLRASKTRQLPTPLGLSSQEKLLYLGPPDQTVDVDTLVECQGRQYRVRNAHKVGQGACPYWWAVLCPRDEVTL